MCFAAAAVPMWLQAAGTAASVIGAISQANAARQSANYNAAVARNNQAVAEWQANDVMQRSQTAELESKQAAEDAKLDHARRVAGLKGTQTASMAARGLDVGEGTAANILTETDYFGAQDARTIAQNAENQIAAIRTNAARDAWGFRVQGTNYAAQADLNSMRARNENPLLAGAGTLLTGAGSVADKWLRRGGYPKD